MQLQYQQLPLTEFPRQMLKPANWSALSIYVATYVLSRPNLKNRVRLGRVLGEIAWRLAKSRRHITEQNIRACFPTLSPKQQQQLAKQSLIESLVGLVETAAAWWLDPEEFRACTEFHGTENLLGTLAAGHGVLLIGGHYSTLDMGGALLSLITEYDVTYRANNHPCIDWVIRNGRQRFTHDQIERTDIRSFLSTLKQGRVLWYAPDQDYGASRSVFAPFFDVPTATIKATSRFAAQKNTKTLFISHFRKKDNSGYVVFFSPPLENFPTGDEVEDARMINQQLEQEIRRVPEQYMWVHRRFKTRPPGSAPFYQ